MKLLLRRQDSPLDALDDLILSYLVAAERRGLCPIVAQIERVTGIHHATVKKRLNAMRERGIAALSVANVWQALPLERVMNSSRIGGRPCEASEG